MKKLVTILSLLLLVLLSGCASKETQTVNIGVIAPLSGPLAIFGERMQMGLDMAVQEINAKGGIDGKQVILIYEDTECNPKKTAESLNKLKNVDEIDAFVGPFCGTSMAVAGTFSDQHQLLGITPNNNYQKFGEHYFSIMGPTREEDKTLATYAKNDLQLENVSILHFDNIFGTKHAKYFEEEFEKIGGKIVGKEKINFQTKDFKTLLLKLEKNAQGIYIVHSVSGEILNDIKRLDLDLQVLAQWGIENPTIPAVAKDNANGLVYTFPETVASKPFSKEFAQRYNELPTVVSSGSYDTLQIIKVLFESCTSKDIVCTTNKMRNLRYEGAAGRVDFNEDTWGADKKYIIKEIRNQSFVQVQR